MDLTSKRVQLAQLRSQVRLLEAEIAAEELAAGWQNLRDYPVYHATVGALLGVFGAAVSLLFNVVGALVAGKDPLELIRIYLTFPLGENALRLTGQTHHVYALGDGMILALGCCLYLATGMLLGIPVALGLSWLAPTGSLRRRLIVAGVIALLIWVLNFYGILAWLQPMLFGGRWIVDGTHLPWWVAAATHLVFGGTIALLYPLVVPSPTAGPGRRAEPGPAPSRITA